MAASRLEFRILGPLVVRVDDAVVTIGGPKQRALLALLLLNANRVVSRERLVDELFPDQSVSSADHALRNQVSRLRKVLIPAARDEPRLAARPPGYLLRVEPGELDLEHFERLAADGREAAARDDPRTAAESFRAAEALWSGRPLADLEFEPFARVEVERLEELRLAVVEERVDAELALGRHLALVPELEALAAEHPFRERFRAQLMLALYRCGRQAEGLEVYQETRKLLDDELGLEPGVELRELQRAILAQDEELNLEADTRAQAVPVVERLICPYKGLAPFEAADAELFFGRERLVDELVARLAGSSLLAVIGPSGSGKSSLLHAGLLPGLEQWEQAVLRPGERPTAELENAVEGGLPEALIRVPRGDRLIVAVDQFEEVFAASVAEKERRAFVDALVEAAWDADRRAAILIGLRADFFGHVAPYVELADLIGANHVLLAPMTRSELRRVIEGPAERAGLDVEPELVDAVVDDVAGETGGLPLLSTAMLDLWLAREGRTLTLASYERTGGVSGAIGRHAEAAFQSLGAEKQAIAKRIVLRLVAGGDGDVLTRRRARRDELDADEGTAAAAVLATLVEKRLLVVGEKTVDLVHEALLVQWPRLVAWLEEDAEGRRLHTHLTKATAEWEAVGRDPSELYRGARLAATLDWADSNGRLNRLEREFLEASRTEFAREGRRQRRVNRRLRTLLAAALALLLAALAAGAVAARQWGTARTQETAAVAQRLGAQALVEPRLDRSLLLAREGATLDDSAATRSNLLAALLRSPAAVAVLHGTGQRVLDSALSADGRTFVARGDDGGVTFFDTRTLRELPRRLTTSEQISYFGAIVRPVRGLTFSPDDRTLAVGSTDGHVAQVFLVDRRTHRERAVAGSSDTAVAADVAYSPDGRTFVTGEVVSGATNPPDEVLVVRRATDARELRRSSPIAGGRLVGFTNDGRFLLVTSGETRSLLLDAQTFKPVRTFPVSGSPVLSPRGDTAAFGSDEGSIVVVDLRTGNRRPMTRRANGGVDALAFSADGKVLASASDSGSVDVWDVPTASLRETFRGHAGAANGPLFSRDGRTLYSGSKDGSLIVWDVSGARRLGWPFRFSPRAVPGSGRHTPVPNASWSVAVSPDSSLFATTPGARRVTLWRTRDHSVVGELHGPLDEIDSLVFSHDGRLLVATGNLPQTVVWNVASRKVVRLLGPAPAGGASGVAISPDDRLVATGGVDGIMRVYDLATGREIGRDRSEGSFQDVDFSPDGKLVAGAGLLPEIVIWNVARRTHERTISQEDAMLAIRFSPDGKTIATGDIPGNVDFWDPASGRKVGPTLGGHNGAVLSVSFNPRGTQLATTSSDGQFRLWDVASGKLIGAPLPGAETGGWGVFGPDGKQIVAVFGSGTGMMWNVDPRAWERHACRVAHRNLTRSEWRDLLPQRAYRPACR
jgi:WD40 repeat protein/DNA-binding SARP family transcriptional activator